MPAGTASSSGSVNSSAPLDRPGPAGAGRPRRTHRRRPRPASSPARRPARRRAGARAAHSVDRSVPACRASSARPAPRRRPAAACPCSARRPRPRRTRPPSSWPSSRPGVFGQPAPGRGQPVAVDQRKPELPLPVGQLSGRPRRPAGRALGRPRRTLRARTSPAARGVRPTSSMGGRLTVPGAQCAPRCQLMRGNSTRCHEPCARRALRRNAL